MEAEQGHNSQPPNHCFGPAGAVSVEINGLILAIWYVCSGRLLPLMAFHYLYDDLRIMQVVILIRKGVIAV